MLRPLRRSASISSILAKHISTGLLIDSIRRDEIKKREIFIERTSKGAKRALKTLGIKVEHEGLENIERLEKNALIISNHLSYIDILLISSTIPTAFVTSNDLKETKFLGRVAKLGGSFFVERRHQLSMRSEIDRIADELKRGLSITVFPEATTSDGSQIKPFKRSLFAAAQRAEIDILPICINYTHIDGEPVTAKNRDRIFYYGDMTFFSHLKGMLKHRSIGAKLSVLKPVSAGDFDDSRDLMAHTYELINSVYKPIR